jgi:formylglycine-generating enzyme required for sulfatase activity
MTNFSVLTSISKDTAAILGEPFEWCFVPGGKVTLIDATSYGGTSGGDYQVPDFAIGKYFITNSQYKKFIDHPNGFYNIEWWKYSPEGALWRRDHRNPKPPAFPGADLPATRVSWFDSMAFCRWLSAELKETVRLPTEMEWQRAAVGDTGWNYPWGNELDETRGNYAKHVGQTSPVGSYPAGQSPFGVMDMMGNLWQWCLTIWGSDSSDPGGYVYRTTRGGAWNVSNPEYLRAIDRGAGQPPRGRLNDAGFRIALPLTQ